MDKITINNKLIELINKWYLKILKNSQYQIIYRNKTNKIW